MIVHQELLIYLSKLQLGLKPFTARFNGTDFSVFTSKAPACQSGERAPSG